MDRDSFSTAEGPEPQATSFDRLNSWKEIATYLGKGVRTVQRWEVQMGLPVRRLGREGGEIVYALRSEIDTWMDKQARARNNEAHATAPATTASPGLESRPLDPAWPSTPVALPGAHARTGPILLPPTTSEKTAHAPSFRPPFWTALFVVLAILGPLSMFLSAKGGRTSAAGPSPARATVEGGSLRAWSADGAALWSQEFKSIDGSRLDTRDAIDPSSVGRRILVADVDGDRRSEVLVISSSPSGTGGAIQVFNADGTLRFSHAPGRPVTYGTLSYPGFNANGIFMLQKNDGSPSLWVSASNMPWFPSVLQEISSRGEVLSEYWSNGTILNVTPVTLKGRSFLLVGAYNNEKHGASLAFLDRARASGTAPAENPYYRCFDCASGEPEEFIVFPPSDLLHEATGGQGSAVVIDARLAGGSDVVATIRQMSTRVPGETAPLEATVNYTLSASSLELRHILPGWGFLAIHKAYERAGRLNHAFGPDEEKALSRILRWSGGRFVPLEESLHDPVFARVSTSSGSGLGLKPRRARRG